MWPFKKKRTKCDFTVFVGRYFKLIKSPYRNFLDEVRLCERKKCSCGSYEDFLLGKQSFPPSVFDNRKDGNKDEKEYIQEIKKQGFEEEFEINIRTGQFINK